MNRYLYNEKNHKEDTHLHSINTIIDVMFLSILKI